MLPSYCPVGLYGLALSPVVINLTTADPPVEKAQLEGIVVNVWQHAGWPIGGFGNCPQGRCKSRARQTHFGDLIFDPAEENMP
jgi:hypothetical protein